jgi:hypothetical protein
MNQVNIYIETKLPSTKNKRAVFIKPKSGVAFQDSPVSVFSIRTLSTNPTNCFWGIFVVLLVRLRLVRDSTIPHRPKLSLSHPGVKFPAVWDTWRKGVRAGRKSALQTRFETQNPALRAYGKTQNRALIVKLIPAAVEREHCSTKCWHYLYCYTQNTECKRKFQFGFLSASWS